MLTLDLLKQSLNTIKIIFWIKKNLSLPFTRLKVAICLNRSKITTLPSRARFLRRHILKTFSVPIIVLLKFCSSSLFLLYEKEKKILVFLLHLWFNQCIWFHGLPLRLLSVVLTRLLHILISLVLNLKTMKIKKLDSTILLLNTNFLRKKLRHLHKLYIGLSLLFLTIVESISRHNVSKYADTGSPCRVPFSS